MAECFAATPRRAFDAVWAPLCLAALNTPPERASAQVFAAVLAGGVHRARRRQRFPDPRPRPLGALPRRGGALRRGERRRGPRRRRRAPARQPMRGASPSRPAPEVEAFAAVVVAVGPHQLAALVGGDGGDAGAPANPWRAALAQVSRVRLRVDHHGVARLSGAGRAAGADRPPRRRPRPMGVRPQRRAGRIGAARRARAALGGHQRRRAARSRRTTRALAARIDAQLRRLDPALPAPIWARIVAERRATYACTPGLDRPVAGRVAPGRYLAGDYTDARPAADAGGGRAQRRRRRTGAAGGSRLTGCRGLLPARCATTGCAAQRLATPLDAALRRAATAARAVAQQPLLLPVPVALLLGVALVVLLLALGEADVELDPALL